MVAKAAGWIVTINSWKTTVPWERPTTRTLKHNWADATMILTIRWERSKNSIKLRTQWTRWSKELLSSLWMSLSASIMHFTRSARASWRRAIIAAQDLITLSPSSAITCAMAIMTVTIIPSPRQRITPSTSGGTVKRWTTHRCRAPKTELAFPTGSSRTPGVEVGATMASSRSRLIRAMAFVALI